MQKQSNLESFGVRRVSNSAKADHSVSSTTGSKDQKDNATASATKFLPFQSTVLPTRAPFISAPPRRLYGGIQLPLRVQPSANENMPDKNNRECFLMNEVLDIAMLVSFLRGIGSRILGIPDKVRRTLSYGEFYLFLC